MTDIDLEYCIKISSIVLIDTFLNTFVLIFQY